MAPVKTKRPTARAKAARSVDQRGRYAPPSPSHTSAAATPQDAEENTLPHDGTDFADFTDFKLSKRDKRTIKHSHLLHKVREAGISKEQKKPAQRRRRPSKKLNTAIADLGDALPDAEDGWEDDEDDKAGAAATAAAKSGKMKLKSLKHRPGAMKRKRAMEGREIERFGKNLAEMSAKPGDRWAALRGFIGGTLETNKAFG